MDIYIDIDRQTDTHRQTDRHTHRKRERGGGRETDRHTDRQIEWEYTVGDGCETKQLRPRGWISDSTHIHTSHTTTTIHMHVTHIYEYVYRYGQSDRHTDGQIDRARIYSE